MRIVYILSFLFCIAILSCNKTEDLFANEITIEKANGVIHSTMKDDRDGKIYATIILDSVEWMNQNLDYDSESELFILCPEDQDGEEKCDESLGRLYESNRAGNNRFCPDGWRAPSFDEWLIFIFSHGDLDVYKDHMELNGINLQYAGVIAGTQDETEVSYFYKEAGYYAVDDGSYVFIDTTGTGGPGTFNFYGYVSCRCVRSINPEDNPFFDECSDGIMNGNETGIDCGGSDCEPCAVSCSDGIMNGDETGVDCGGSDCEPCTPSCTDGVLNGDEVEIDCGGAICPPCGSTFIDARDGQEYNFNIFGSQSWMTENLNYAGAGVCYDNINSNCDTYGRLYSYDDVINQNICPQGWHVPSDEEYKVLEALLGMSQEDLDLNDGPFGRGTESEIGNQLKTEDWISTGSSIMPNGFFATPSGMISTSGSVNIGIVTYHITSTLTSMNRVLLRIMSAEATGIGREDLFTFEAGSCRCVKD